jgi:cobalt/nickel transport system permease protein
MHMADALLSPVVGGTMAAVSAVAVAVCARRVRLEGDDRRVPLMGVLGAFLFAAQMINFGIPGTGSSGHLGGGLLLAILLGPSAGFLVVTSVLIVQALFFADGGLLALGCNVFNIGLLPAFVGYPLYRLVAGQAPGRSRQTLAAIVAAVVSLQLGALAVVVETVASGISALPFDRFVAFMLPIHLAIGVVEGIVTAAVVSFVRTTRPGVLDAQQQGDRMAVVVPAFLMAAVLMGGVGAWYASTSPDGLEWSIERTADGASPRPPDPAVHGALERLQQAVAFLPGYAFRPESSVSPAAQGPPGEIAQPARGQRAATTLSGLLGAALALACALLVGLALRARRD